MDEEVRKSAAEFIVDVRRFRLAFNGLISRTLPRFGTNLPQLTVLALLGETEEMTMGALSEAIGTTMGASTNLVDRLVHAGHVKREHGTEDRRIVKAGITPAGRDLLDRVVAEGRILFARLLDEIPPEERRTFLEVNAKLTRRMQEELGRPEEPSKTEA